jgi:homocysteine S-methyltransferase
MGLASKRRTTMNPIQTILNQYPLMILDGAFATELEKRGCDLNHSLWSAKVLMESPEMIAAVHDDYFHAGADCVITASYQATVAGFQRHGLSEAEALALIGQSVAIATGARDHFWASCTQQHLRPKPLVAASVGPYGAFLADGSEYRGDYAISEEELIAFHYPRMKALLDAGADILACETIPCLKEARAIAHLLQKEFPGHFAWISFSARDGKHTSNGELLADCALELDSCSQIAAIGINCTAPRHITSLIHEIKAHTTKPIIIYPNSGECYQPTTKSWSGSHSDASFSQSAQNWHAAGARILGGCCRTSPEDISAIARWARPSF